ncbi:unnamed protein product [Clavelina lepadiformis]|uniref:Jumping translocation breakpoint protein n=1 Tax=Clavelina lepadiformis TaxID=159417 RepID=A0ABP0G9H4_CLALP
MINCRAYQHGICLIIFLLCIVHSSAEEKKNNKGIKRILDVIDECWENEEYDVEVKCHVCDSHENSALQVCSRTGYIEQVKCKSGTTSYKSCPRDPEREMVIFWKFEGVMIFVSVLAGAIVMLRMRKLDRENIERIQRQISAL